MATHFNNAITYKDLKDDVMLYIVCKEIIIEKINEQNKVVIDAAVQRKIQEMRHG